MLLIFLSIALSFSYQVVDTRHLITFIHNIQVILYYGIFNLTNLIICILLTTIYTTASVCHTYQYMSQIPALLYHPVIIGLLLTLHLSSNITYKSYYGIFNLTTFMNYILLITIHYYYHLCVIPKYCGHRYLYMT